MKIIPLHPLEKGLFTIVDDDIYDLFAQTHWTAAREKTSHYATHYKRFEKVQQMFRLARLIMNPPPHLQVDHINRNTLDNRRANLRLATNQQNQFNQKLSKANTSGFKGVAFQKHSPTKPWRAFVSVDKKKKHIGYFSTPIEAAKAYDEAAIKHYGEYAATNKDLGLLKNNSTQKDVRGRS